MFRINIKLVMALLVAALLATTLTAAEKYVSPRGFSLEYPDHWRIASKEILDAASEDAKEMLAKIGEVDFSRIAVAVFDPYAEANVNVIVGHFGAELSTATPSMLADVTRKQMVDMGIQPLNVEGKWTYLGTTRALTLVVDVDYKRGLEPIRQLQYYIVAEDNTVFVVTCSTLMSNFDEYEPTFAAIAQSITVTDPRKLADEGV